MKVTFVHPCIGRRAGQKDYIKTWQMEPLAPAVLAGMTPEDVDIAFYDDRIETIPYEEPTDLVAISVETYTAKRAYQIASEYRRRGVPVVMGGFHATLVPDEVSTYAESVVIGEAEGLWPEVVEDAKHGSLKKFYSRTERPKLGSTMPDRSIFAGKRYLKVGLVETSRGCPFRCDFCAIHAYFKSTQTRRPVERVVEEVESLTKSGSKVIFFVDDNIIGNRYEAKKLFKELIPLRIRWMSQASITVAYDEELVALMKESGCYGLLIGFESLNEENLKRMNKGFNAARGGFESALQVLSRHGIKLYPTFVFGYDADNESSFDETVSFCEKHRFLVAAFNHLTPFPGTPLYARLEQEDALNYETWWLDERYRYGEAPMDTQQLSGKRIKSLCVSARKRFYSLSSITRRMLNPVNCPDLFSLQTFWMLNLLFRSEVSVREGYPLGDESYPRTLLRANHTSSMTSAEHLAERTTKDTIAHAPSNV